MNAAMNGLALRSLRHRPRAAIATFLAVLLGTLLIGSFATLAESSSGAPAPDDGTLVILGAVVGGWGALIVLFSVASTVGITTTQRAAEIGLLRTIGATPRQARRLIARETGAIALAAAVIGALAASVGGRLLFDLIRSGGLVSDGTRYDAGPASVAGAAVLVLAAAAIAAAVAARRATRGPAGVLVRESGGEQGRMRWWRVAIALLLVGYGIAMAVVTVAVTAHADDPYAAMSTSGSSSILVGLGLAVLAPVLLRWGAGPVRLLAGTSATAHLASYNTVRRAHLLAGVLAPVVVLTSAAVGTLVLVDIDARTLPAGTPDSDTIALLNNVVVGMLSLFAAIMVVNAFVATVAHRREELLRLRLLGATSRQVRGSVVAEAGIVAAIGVVLGTLAAATTVVPFAVARDEGMVPDGGLWLVPAVAAAVVVLTLGSARGAVRSAAPEPV
ncbi:FtsX-like permease family protein [Nocardioides carbamazepini]|uniref:FtsX-like permease family protein n=1 Tax=Nocardioides carbamazepini TaxID=2854259 RepID=UPI002149CA5F|nr:FtsX-like permease family protein [Nocardioides carbamazepini]MCR1784130.1 FtsX-like permease family protein [Nocardioides carbamazepini]